MHELGLVDDQLAGEVHQVVQPVDVHAHRLGGPLPGIGCAARPAGLAGRLAGRGGRCRGGRRPAACWPSAAGSPATSVAVRLLGSAAGSDRSAPSRLNARFQDAGDPQPVLDGFQGLVGGQPKAKTIELLDLVELLRRRIALGQVAQLGEFFVDQAGFQPGGGQGGLESHFADIGRPAAAVPRRSCRPYRQQFARQLAEMVRACRSLLQFGHVPLQGVGAFQEDVGHAGRKRTVRLEPTLQQVLHQVGQFRDPVQADGGGRALDLVRGAHQALQIVAVASALQRQQGAGQPIQRRLALVDEDRKVLFRNLVFVPHVLQGIGGRSAGLGGRPSRAEQPALAGSRLLLSSVGGGSAQHGPLGIGLRRLLPLHARRLQQPADGIHHGAAIDRLASRLLQAVDQGDQLIESHEDQLGHVAIDGQFVLAGGVEDVFDLVRQVVDVRESQHGRQSFEAVGRPEHLVEQVGSHGSLVVVVERADPFVELEQPLVELREELVRLVEEVAQKAVQQFVLAVCLRVAHGLAPAYFWAVGTTRVADARSP